MEVRRAGQWGRDSEKRLSRENGSSVSPLGPAKATSVAELQKWPLLSEDLGLLRADGAST